MKKSRKVALATVSAVTVAAAVGVPVGIFLSRKNNDEGIRINSFKKQKEAALKDVLNYYNDATLKKIVVKNKELEGSAVDEWAQIPKIINENIGLSNDIPRLEFEAKCLKATIDARLSRYNDFANKSNLEELRLGEYESLDNFWIEVEKMSSNFKIKTDILSVMQDAKLAIARKTTEVEIKKITVDFKTLVLNSLFGNLNKAENQNEIECTLAKFEIVSYFMHLENRMDILNKKDSLAHPPKILRDLRNYVSHDTGILIELIDKKLPEADYMKELEETEENIKKKILEMVNSADVAIEMTNSRRQATERAKEINTKIRGLISDISSITDITDEMSLSVQQIEADASKLMQTISTTDSLEEINAIITSEEARDLKSDLRNFVYLYSQLNPSKAHILHTKLDLILFILISKNPYVVPIEDYDRIFSSSSKEIVEIFNAGQKWFESYSGGEELSDASLRSKMLIDQVYDRFSGVVKQVNDEENLYDQKYSSCNEITALIPKRSIEDAIPNFQRSEGYRTTLKNSGDPNFDELIEAISALINNNTKEMLTAGQVDEILRIKNIVIQEMKAKTNEWITQHREEQATKLIMAQLEAKSDITNYYNSLLLTIAAEGSSIFIREDSYKNYLDIKNIALSAVDEGKTEEEVKNIVTEQKALIKQIYTTYNAEVVRANTEAARKESYDENVDEINNVDIPTFDSNKRYKNLYDKIVETRNEGLNSLYDLYKSGGTSNDMCDLTITIKSNMKEAIEKYDKYLIQELVVVENSGITNGANGFFFKDKKGDIFVMSKNKNKDQSLMVKWKDSKVWEVVSGTNISTSKGLKMIEDDYGNIYSMGSGKSGLQVMKSGSKEFVDVEYEDPSDRLVSGSGGAFNLTDGGNLYVFGNASAFVLKKGQTKFQSLKTHGLDISPAKGVTTILTKKNDLIVFHDKVYIRRSGGTEFTEIENQGWYDDSSPDLIQVDEDNDGNVYVVQFTSDAFDGNQNNHVWELKKGDATFTDLTISGNENLSYGDQILVDEKTGDLYVAGNHLWVKKNNSTEFIIVPGSEEWWDPDGSIGGGAQLYQLKNGNIYVLKEMSGSFVKRSGDDSFVEIKEAVDPEYPDNIFETKNGDIYLIGNSSYVKTSISDKFEKVRTKSEVDDFFGSVVLEADDGTIYWLIAGYPLLKMVDVETAKMYTLR